jgi:hypothetical protein
VLELGGAARLAQEAVHVLLAGEAAAARDLDGHGAAQLGVAGAEDRAEGADPQFFHQLELAQPPPPRARTPTGRRGRSPSGLGGLGEGQEFRGDGFEGCGLVRLPQLPEQGVGQLVQGPQGGFAGGAVFHVPGHLGKHRA